MARSRRIVSLVRRGGRGSSGGLTPTQRAEAVIASLSPSYDFDARYAALSGGNVASIPNKRGADALVMAAGTLAAPASDVLFGGAPSIAFTGTQWLDSNLPASAWKFLHDGSGCELFHVFASTSAAAVSVQLASLNASAVRGLQIFTDASQQQNVQLYSRATAGAAVFSNSFPAGATTNVATYANYAYSEASPVKALAFSKAALGNSGSPTTFSALDPDGTLRLGAQGGGAFPAQMKWVRTIIFPRVLHEYERQLVREAFQALYAIAAPSLVGADRDIMSLLPFSWARFDAYSTSGGNVLAVLDKARPGHTFAQGTGSNQVANPVASANFNGQLAATFGTNKTYQSSLPAAAWTSLADKAAIFLPFRSTSFANVQIMLETWNSGNGFATSLSQTSGNWNSAVYRPTTGQSTVGLPGNAINVPRLYQAHNDTLSLFSKATALGTNSVAATAGTIGATTKSLVFGARSGALFAFGDTPEIGLLFDRVLNASERARVEAYYQARYNLAA